MGLSVACVYGTVYVRTIWSSMDDAMASAMAGLHGARVHDVARGYSMDDAMDGAIDELMDHTMASSIGDAVEGPMDDATESSMDSSMVSSMDDATCHLPW